MNVWKCFKYTLQHSINLYSAIGKTAVVNSREHVNSHHVKDSPLCLIFSVKYRFLLFTEQFFFDVGIYYMYLYNITFHISKFNFWPYVPFKPRRAWSALGWVTATRYKCQSKRGDWVFGWNFFNQYCKVCMPRSPFFP